MRYYNIDDKLADKVGAELTELLSLSRCKGEKDLWPTAKGRKSYRGLARTVLAVFDKAGVFDERTPSDD